MNAIVTGGTGLIGRRLLEQFPDAVVLTRDPSAAERRLPGVRALRWSPGEDAPPAELVAASDVIFHLAGEPVAEGRWTAAKKRRIRESRVEGTRSLVAGLAALHRRPGVLVCASAVGFYGDRGDEELDEASAAGAGFLPEVCAAWEREALAAEDLGVRVVCLRIGVVLARGGGALARMLPPFKMGAGGRLGDGRQWMPWVHIDDVAGLLVHASRDASMHGPVNAVSPNPVTNADFTRALGRVLGRPAVLPVPKLALRTLFGEMSEILLASQRVQPRAALACGYRFVHPSLDSALANLVREPAFARS